MYGVNPYQSQNYINQGYNPYQSMQYQQMNQAQQSQQGLIRVNGIDGARAYQNMGANSQVALFDANEDLMYVKCTDGAGFPSIRTFRFEEVTENNQTISNNNYVSREEMESYVKQFISEQFQQGKDEPATASK